MMNLCSNGRACNGLSSHPSNLESIDDTSDQKWAIFGHYMPSSTLLVVLKVPSSYGLDESLDLLGLQGF